MNNEKRTILACVICGKAFEVSSVRHVCCSSECGAKYSAIDPSKREVFRRAVQMKRRPPRIDCQMYIPECNDCRGLTGLWCEWEVCKFYKPRGGSNE